MNEILSTAITALVLLAGLAALIRYAARDVFAGPFPSTTKGAHLHGGRPSTQFGAVLRRRRR